MFDTIDKSRLLSKYHAQKLLDFLSQRLIIYQNDMIWFLYNEFNIVVNQSMISRLLKEAKYSRKIAQKVVAEHDEKLCSEWKQRLMSWTSDQLVFLVVSIKALLVSKQIDSTFFFTLSSHANACSLTDWKYDWASIDLSLHVIQSLKRSKRWSILSAFFIDEYIAWEMHHDFITKEIFLNFMWSQMLSICNSEEIESRSVMIMNNARIHQSAELNELCESFEMHLVKLSFYLSDYNLIESSFSVLKAVEIVSRNWSECVHD